MPELDVLVNDLNPEVCETRCSPSVAGHCKIQAHQNLWEADLIGLQCLKEQRNVWCALPNLYEGSVLKAFLKAEVSTLSYLIDKPKTYKMSIRKA